MGRFHIEKYNNDGASYLVDRERGKQRCTPLRTAAEAIELRDLLVREFPEPAQEEPTPQPDPDEVRRLIARYRLAGSHLAPVFDSAAAWLRDREHSCEEVVRARHYGMQQPATPAQTTGPAPLSIEQVIAACEGNTGRFRGLHIYRAKSGFEARSRVLAADCEAYRVAFASTPEAAIQALGTAALEKIRERVARDSETLKRCGGES